MHSGANFKRFFAIIFIGMAEAFSIPVSLAQGQQQFQAGPTNFMKSTSGEGFSPSNTRVYALNENTNDNSEKSTGDNSSALPTYSLEKCYEIALEQNISVKQGRNNIKANIIDRKTALSGLLPSVSYDMGHYFSFGKNIDPVTNAFSYESFSGGYTALGLEMELFSGFRKINAIKQSAFLIRSAEYNEKKTELELLTNITLTYARLLLDKEQLKNQRNIIYNTLKELDIINEKIKVGRLSKYESYTFNGRLNTEQADLVTLQNDSLAALLDLKQLINSPYKVKFNIATVDDAVLSGIYSANISEDDMIESVLAAHPAIKQTETDEQASRLRAKITKSNFFPTLSIGGNLVSNYSSDQKDINGGKIPFSSQLNNNLGENINISLRIPIFSQMYNANLVKKEKINISNAQMDVENARSSITANVLHLINDFNSAKEKYQATLSAFEQNKLSYSLYFEKYRLGQISSVELITAQDILNTSASKYTESRLNLYFRFQLLELLKKYSTER